LKLIKMYKHSIISAKSIHDPLCSVKGGCNGEYELVEKSHVESKTPEQQSVMPTASLAALGLSMTRGASQKGSATSLPPQIEITPNVRHVYRFVSNNANSVSVTNQDILGAIGGICTVANSTVRLWATSFKLNSVKMWPSANTTTTPTYTDIAWGAGAYGSKDSELLKAVPGGCSVTGLVTFKPPKGSFATNWISNTISGNYVIFLLQCSVGSILDVDLSFTLCNQVAPANASIATGTLGNIYYLFLDGSTTHQLQPYGLPFTF
jgi:hypothetical protein